MLRSFREVMEILAKQPVLLDTGESPAAVRPRSFADAENMLAMELARMENYTCRVKLPSGAEHLLRTLPSPEGVGETELAGRLQQVQERMIERGLVSRAQDVEKAVAERHTALRQQASDRPRRRQVIEPRPRRTG
jgi:hypothetical protein